MEVPAPTVPKDAYPPRFRSEAGESYKIRYGPSQRRLADVPRLSYAEGVELGGQILWEERPQEVHAKQRAPQDAAIGFGGLIAAMGAISALAGMAGPGPIVIGVAGLVLSATGPFISRVMEQKGWYRLTPICVYAHGISLGGPDGPYLPFDGLYAIEDAVTPKWAFDFTHLTFMDGSEVSVAFGYGKQPGVVIRKEFKRVKGILHNKFPRAFAPRLDWAKDAEAFMASLRYLKGPVRLQIEALALEQGVEQVDLEFIQKKWRMVGEHHGLGTSTFLGQANAAFNDGRKPR